MAINIIKAIIVVICNLGQDFDFYCFYFKFSIMRVSVNAIEKASSALEELFEMDISVLTRGRYKLIIRCANDRCRLIEGIKLHRLRWPGSNLLHTFW